MKKNNALTRDYYRRPFGRTLSGNALFTLLLIIILFPACAGKMSVEEAKEVTVSMSGEAFVPPPRRIDDILSILEQPGEFDPGVTMKYRVAANQSPPANANYRELAYFYRNRAKAAISIFRFSQALEDSRTAFQYLERARLKANFLFLLSLGRAEAWAGNFRKALDLLERSLKKEKNGGAYNNLVTLYARTGDLESAEKMKSNGIAFLRQQKRDGAWAEISIASMTADIFEARGKFKEAERHRRHARSLSSTIKWQAPSYSLALLSRFALNIERQNDLIEAEFEWRDILKKVIGLAGKESEGTGAALGHMGENLQKQGRLVEAEKLLIAALRIMEQSGLSADSYLTGRIRMFHANVLTEQYKFFEAMQEFDLLRKNLLDNNYLYENIFARNPNLMLSLIKTDRVKEAFTLISAAYDVYTKNYGDQNYLKAEIQSLRGLAYAKMNKLKQAIEDFSEAISILLTKNMSGENDFSSRQRLKIILEAYIDLLGRIDGNQLELKLIPNAAAEAFRLADAARGQMVQSALGASGARMAVENPVLADLIRREQDTDYQIKALQSILVNTIAAPEDQRDPAALEKMVEKLETLRKARRALVEEIKKQFPKYSDFTNPQPATVSMVKKHLQPNEALISIYTTDDHTYVWTIPSDGEIKFSKSNLGAKKITQLVNQLRKTLAPDPEKLGDIPAFNYQKAYVLYSHLLKPVEAAWKDARHLIIVASGPLGQLPFAILPTDSVKLQEDAVLFANYRHVPWLIRKVSITRQPSVSSFVTLRSLPQGNPERKAFAGFGDPFFNKLQVVEAKEEKAINKHLVAVLQKPFQVRGLRITDVGNLDSEAITSSNLSMLNRLPDTTEEINSIASALGADPVTDVFVGKRASEHLVKTMDLYDRRVIAFATHALVPGDLDGLNQPALALCSPEVTGEDEDGLLTLGEILKLKLNADWVVLSACNTGAAAGAGAEAVSGLGRAFFYAGSRALLVSMWPVETSSARLLTTRLFEYQKKENTLSRASALRKSILALIDGRGIKDQVSGKIAASYAHPFFWAPFIIMGDSGLDLN